MALPTLVFLLLAAVVLAPLQSSAHTASASTVLVQEDGFSHSAPEIFHNDSIIWYNTDNASGLTHRLVYDHDGDGLNDLLVGDVQWLYTTLPPLTPEQEAEKARIMPEYTRVNDALDALFEKRNSFVGKEGGIPKELEERLEKLLEEVQMNKLLHWFQIIINSYTFQCLHQYQYKNLNLF